MMFGVLPIIFMFLLHSCWNHFLSTIFPKHNRNNVDRYCFIPCMFLNLIPISTNFNIKLSSDGWCSPNNIFVPPPVLSPFFVHYFSNIWQNNVKGYYFIPCIFWICFLYPTILTLSLVVSVCVFLMIIYFFPHQCCLFLSTIYPTHNRNNVNG